MTASLAVKGGIGDFLQCLPFMLANPDRRYLVASHQTCAPEFFAAVGLRIEEVPFSRTVGVELCPRQLFFDKNPFRKFEQLSADSRPTIGVHLGGSDYSLSVEARFGFPSKALPFQVMASIMRSAGGCKFWLFGSSLELRRIPWEWEESSDLKLVYHEDVTVSLAQVAECDVFIGSDSCFKTMSAMLGIPTVVWIGDYKDITRDDNFINPYIAAGVMSVFRYRNLDDSREINAGVEFCARKLNHESQASASHRAGQPPEARGPDSAIDAASRLL